MFYFVITVSLIVVLLSPLSTQFSANLFTAKLPQLIRSLSLSLFYDCLSVLTCGPNSVWPDWAIFKNSVSNFLLKVAQMYGGLGIQAFWKHHYSSKNCCGCGYFLGNFLKKIGLFFISTSVHTGSYLSIRLLINNDLWHNMFRA